MIDSIPAASSLDPALFSTFNLLFLTKITMSLVSGVLIGAERESRLKPAGISTHCFIIGGAMIFSMLSSTLGDGDPTRIASQIVGGVGFLGAGIIIKEEGKLSNLTTAASVWFAAAIGMSIGFGWYFVAAVSTLYSVLVPRIPHIQALRERKNR